MIVGIIICLYLEHKFNLHLVVNAAKELPQKSAPHRDFYNAFEVDTYVHHADA